MEKTILVTGKDTFLGNEISEFFLQKSSKVVATVTPRKDAETPSDDNPDLLIFPWQRRSAISAKNLLLQAVHQFGRLEEAWLVFSPEVDSASLSELKPLEIEEILDLHVKGFLFLARELWTYQTQNPEFRLHFVLFDEDLKEQAPFSALQYQGLRAFVSSLLVLAGKKNLPVWGHESTLPQADAFARFLVALAAGTAKSSAPGRWQNLTDKKTIFGLFHKD